MTAQDPSRDRAPLNLDDEDDDLDLSQFAPKGPSSSPKTKTERTTPGKAELRELANEEGFVSRQAGVRRRRRRRSGRNEQINIKTTAAYADRFYSLAEKYDWMCAVVFERALDALEHELAAEEGARTESSEQI